ncbi:hypothetical protein EKL97_14600 [Flavobacterium sp. LS1P28]|uniref:hypothetical protein n=1 Tax=Flavobacterium sp. LS1P28 TaxID=2497752 RepID=UPI000F84A611|nr:hypothetical protein [Flavobacterium sp. LS1P28]RTY78014.1 hypothetical protein EKL97_14600 [Flavobacterium sp. LS1P28]
MKVAYHFNCSDIKERYDSLFYDIVFRKLLKLNEPFISSKILVGDLLIYEMITKADNPSDFLNYLFQIKDDTWKRIISDKVKYFVEDTVFIICFETIQKEIAIKLNEVLLTEERYLGAYEIDNSVELHWWLYGECIGPRFRILNKDINILVDNNEIESQEYVKDIEERIKKIPFDNIDTEFSNYRYSLLDDKHNYENARRTTEWKKGTESIFSTITDEIIAKLTDTAPDLTDKLWSINNTFSHAQTGEQYAQAMTSCRRVFEYVTDCLFPATNDIIDGHSLKKDKYKNRLLEFAKRELKSETNIDLIVTNTTSLFEEWNKLYELSNKGVHSEPHRQECRRCIIRTILLLDDLIAIKRTPFEVNIKTDKFINNFKDRHNASR